MQGATKKVAQVGHNGINSQNAYQSCVFVFTFKPKQYLQFLVKYLNYKRCIQAVSIKLD